MTDITAVLRAVAPRANPAFVAASAPILGAVMAENGFDDVKSQAILISQTAHESGGFRLFEENLNYSAAQLQKTWPRRFDAATAQACAHKPKAIALKVYGDRMGNRPGTNDGWDYRGSSVLQHTGRAEFARVENRTGLSVVSVPDMLRDPGKAATAWKAACTYFVDRGAIAAAKAGDVRQATRKVNGGEIGLKDREILFQRALAAFDGSPVPKGKTTVEQSDDAKRRAKQAAATSAGTGTAAGGTTKQAPDAAWSSGTGIFIAVMLAIAVAGVVAAVVYRRRHQAKRAEVEEMQLQAIEARAAAAEAA